MQAQDQEVTQKESLCVVQNIVSVALSEVLFRRAIVPECAFETTKFGGQKVRKLKQELSSEDRKDMDMADQNKYDMLHDMMSGHIKETIGKKYAHQIILEVTKKPQDEENLDGGEFDVIEKYIFTLDNPSGSPTLEVESDTSSKVCRNKVEIKQRSGTLIRGLVSTLANLDALQKDHWISIRLVYNESAPDDFVRKKKDYFSHDPYQHGDEDTIMQNMDMGGLVTAHNALNVRIEWPVTNSDSAPPVDTMGLHASLKRRVAQREMEKEQLHPCSQDMSDNAAMRISVVEKPIGCKRSKTSATNA